MTKRRVPGAALAALLALSLPAAAQMPQGWVPFSEGMLGPRIASAGTMPDGMPVFVCSAWHNGGFHPGLTGMWTDSCILGFGGREVQVPGFRVYTGRANWAAFRGEVPRNAVEGGQEADGTPLYVCRARQDGAVFAGKYRPGFRGCNVGDQGREIAMAPFDLMVR